MSFNSWTSIHFSLSVGFCFLTLQILFHFVGFRFLTLQISLDFVFLLYRFRRILFSFRFSVYRFWHWTITHTFQNLIEIWLPKKSSAVEQNISSEVISLLSALYCRLYIDIRLSQSVIRKCLYYFSRG
jgi:hypothetical protein